MSQVKDTPVKLFGWTITSVPHDSLSSSSPVCSDSSSSFSSSSPTLPLHMINSQSTCDNLEQDNPSPKISPHLNNESKETSDQHSEITTAATSEEKSSDLKKPDKILPCPRCNSLDTKFCYYNNYNVNQPRHFCRNCQRYWTSGGTMRTVPVGSGRRKNKGWVSSDHDHYQTITSDNTHNAYSNSATQFLSFEHQANEVKINADSVSHEPDNFQEFLPQQVTPYAPLPWPNPSFYPMPVYWGYTTPVWSTLDTSTCLGKRTRDETSREGVREGKDAFVTAKFVSESQSTNTEAIISTKSHVWYPVPTKRQKREQFSSFLHGSETKRFVPQTFLNLHANPAAMARSINFRESM